MKKFAFFLLIVAICFMLAQVMINDHGYVLIAYDGMTFESSLWGGLLLLAIGVGVLWFILLMFQMITAIFSIVHPLTSEGKKIKSRKLFDKGLVEFTMGNWRAAERLFSKSAQCGESLLINYLAAARAAHEAGNYESSAGLVKASR